MLDPAIAAQLTVEDDPALRDRFLRGLPIGRLGEPDDMGGVSLSYKSVPTSYVGGRRKDQDLPEPPPPPDDPLNEELLDQPPKGGVFPQPVAISLNAHDKE